MKLNMFWGGHTAHHQEPKNALAASGFAYMEGCLYVYLVDVVRHSVPDNVHQLHVQHPSTYEKPEAASAFLGSWWWAACRPKHFELHIDNGIIKIFIHCCILLDFSLWKSNEIMWKYMLDRLDRLQVTIKCFAEKMHSSCRISKARMQTHTLIFIASCFSTVTVVTWTVLNDTLFIYCLSCGAKVTRHLRPPYKDQVSSDLYTILYNWCNNASTWS